MNDQAKIAERERPADAAAQTSGASAQERSVPELRAQLLRDATSLELTADTIAPADKRFYQGVASTMREVAHRLGRWEDAVKAMDEARQRHTQAGLLEGLAQATHIVTGLRDPMPITMGTTTPATTWRDACNCILKGLQALTQTYTMKGDAR